MTEDPGTEAVPDLLGLDGTGPVWGMASDDLNATLLVWPAGHEVPEHANEERDVLLIVLDGNGVVVVDGHEHVLAEGNALLIEKGRIRSIRAGPGGLRYVSVHTRRGALQIEGMR